MPIDGGSSALNDSAIAQDFNKNLHEHFKMARRANMKPEALGEGDRGELTHPQTGAKLYIEHNPKTGHAASNPMEATGFYGSGKYGGVAHENPSESRKHLNTAKVQSRSYQEKELGRQNYRDEIRAEFPRGKSKEE